MLVLISEACHDLLNEYPPVKPIAHCFNLQFFCYLRIKLSELAYFVCLIVTPRWLVLLYLVHYAASDFVSGMWLNHFNLWIWQELYEFYLCSGPDDQMTSMIGLATDRALADDEECLKCVSSCHECVNIFAIWTLNRPSLPSGTIIYCFAYLFFLLRLLQSRFWLSDPTAGINVQVAESVRSWSRAVLHWFCSCLHQTSEHWCSLAGLT